MNKKTLSERQNSSYSIDLLKAMRQSYDNGKCFRFTRVVITASIPIISIFIINLNSDSKAFFALISAIWLAFSRLYFINFEKECIKTAAVLQEEFDTKLFKIPWNKMLVGETINDKKRMLLSNSFKGDESKLLNWYPGLNKIANENLTCLMCQKTSLQWEVELRKFYKNKVLLPILLFSLVITIVTLFQFNLSFQTIILSIIIPSLPLLLHLIETLNAHKNQISVQEKVLSSIKSSINDFETHNSDQIREYQNAIFMKRIETNAVPSKIYWLKRDIYDDIAKRINQKTKETDN